MYQAHADVYYRRADGTVTEEAGKIAMSLADLTAVAGEKAPDEIAPADLKAARARMLGRDLARSTINMRVGVILRCFKWAVGEGLVDPAVFYRLACLAPLKAGRSAAREPKAVRPVAAAVVDETCRFLAPVLVAMVRVQQASGMRSGELVRMTVGEVDLVAGQAAGVWVYVPGRHKTSHRGHRRTILLGPAAQAAMRPFLQAAGGPGAAVFSPRAAEAARGRPRSASGRRVGEFYSVAAYRRAIRYAIDQANKARRAAAAAAGRDPDQAALLEAWSPHQLRHAAATAIRAAFGIDAARAVLGHRSVAVAEVYAEIDATLAAKVARKMG